MQRKTLSEQVLVITGASSGIGLATARLAAQRGARVVMTARSEDVLARRAALIRAEGGEVTHRSADMADEQAMREVAEHAVATFGRIDTWVNNAAVSLYGSVEEVSIDDMKRLFDINVWGTVRGCRAALPFLRKTAGTLINIGSVESELALPMNGVYAATKHAIKAFTDSLRIELAKQHANVSVTLVKPASIDTPLFEHAANYMEGDPKPAPPVYSPEVVARAILECAEHPVRDIVIGASGRMMIGLTRATPRLIDSLFRATMFRAQQRRPRPGREPEGSLYRPLGSYGMERGDYEGRVMRSSAYTSMVLHPGKAAVVMLSSIAAVVGISLLARSVM